MLGHTGSGLPNVSVSVQVFGLRNSFWRGGLEAALLVVYRTSLNRSWWLFTCVLS